MLCGVILMEIEKSIVIENGAWNLSKYENNIFKFYDQVNKDYIIYNFSDYTVILLLTFLSILVLS